MLFLPSYFGVAFWRLFPNPPARELAQFKVPKRVKTMRRSSFSMLKGNLPCRAEFRIRSQTTVPVETGTVGILIIIKFFFLLLAILKNLRSHSRRPKTDSASCPSRSDDNVYPSVPLYPGAVLDILNLPLRMPVR